VGFVPAQCNPRQAYVDWLYVNDAAVYDWNSKTLLVVKDEQMADLPTLSRRRVIVQELSNALVQRHIFGAKASVTLTWAQSSSKTTISPSWPSWRVQRGSWQNRYQAEFTRTYKACGRRSSSMPIMSRSVSMSS